MLMLELEHAELSRPARIDLVAAEEVDAALERIDRELVSLRSDAAAAVGQARELEDRVAAEGVDLESTTWMMSRFQSFLGCLWAEAEAELDAVRAAARREADRIRRRSTPLALSFGGAVGAASSAWFDELAERAISDAERYLSWSAPRVPAPSPTVVDVVAAPLVAAPPVIVTPPVFVAQPDEVGAVPVQEVAVPQNDMEAFATLGALDASDADVTRADAHHDPLAGSDTFWIDDDRAQRWWRRRRPSKATALQVGALGAIALAASVHFL